MRIFILYCFDLLFSPAKGIESKKSSKVMPSCFATGDQWWSPGRRQEGSGLYRRDHRGLHSVEYEPIVAFRSMEQNHFTRKLKLQEEISFKAMCTSVLTTEKQNKCQLASDVAASVFSPSLSNILFSPYFLLHFLRSQQLNGVFITTALLVARYQHQMIIMVGYTNLHQFDNFFLVHKIGEQIIVVLFR